MHGGFVGAGMLDAACPERSSSPRSRPDARSHEGRGRGAGVVHIVKNYTGDVMNFKLAAELAEDEGIEVESILTNDDVAVEDSLYTAGRRGVGVTVLAEKIAGATEAGGSLAEVAAVARKVNENGRSFGVAFTSAWTRRRRPRRSRSAPTRWSSGWGFTASRGVAARRSSRRGDRGRDGRGDPRRPRCPERLERARVRQRSRRNTDDRALRHLQRACEATREARGLTATRSLVGDYITSLEMAGASITLLKLDDELTELWDAPVHTPALRWRR